MRLWIVLASSLFLALSWFLSALCESLILQDLASVSEDASIGVTDCPIDGNDDPEVGRTNTVLELVLVGIV